MATYAIGDIQGCYVELLALLDEVNFDAHNDRVWFTGDLVNRGPQSLEVLQFVYDLGEAAVVVLGNHDLHLLACATIDEFSAGKKDTFGDVLEFQARDGLLDWLRRRPLMHRDRDLRYTMVHAGIPPQWTLDDAEDYAREVESVLGGPDPIEFFRHMYGNEPDVWDPRLSSWPRLRLITNYFTRLRYTSARGHIDFKFKGPVGTQPDALIPWYELYPLDETRDSIVFGHWSALHLSSQQMQSKRIYALDTGAVWGGELTAMRLEDGAMFAVSSKVALPIVD